MDILLEIHSPGLDMDQSRWTYHLIFMKEVHEEITSVVECARSSFEKAGRGTVYVSRKQWMAIVRNAVTEKSEPYPCSFLAMDEACSRFDFGLAASGYRQLLHEYDVVNQLALTVEHHPEGLLSCYLIQVRPDERRGEMMG